MSIFYNRQILMLRILSGLLYTKLSNNIFVSFQVIALTICVLSTFINTYFIAPQIVDAMQRCFEIEVEAGVAYVIGYVDKTELKKNPTYSHCYRTFRRHHGMSAIANITTLVCNTMYLYYLSCQL